MAELTWETAGDWDDAQDEEGVVHQDVDNTDHDDDSIVKKGYDFDNFSEIDPDPVACWPLHEDSGTTAHDITGNGNDGTYDGAGPDGTGVGDGVLGTSAPKFDASDDRVSLTDENLDPSGELTMIAWINLDGWGEDGQVLSMNDYSTTLWMDKEQAESGREESVTFRWYDGSDNDRIEAQTENLDTDRWYHLAGVCDGDSAEIYIDGSEDNSKSTSTSPDANHDDHRIGRGDDVDSTFDGRIGGVWLYHDALSADQIQTHYDVVDTNGTLTTGVKTA